MQSTTTKHNCAISGSFCFSVLHLFNQLLDHTFALAQSFIIILRQEDSFLGGNCPAIFQFRIFPNTNRRLSAKLKELAFPQYQHTSVTLIAFLDEIEIIHPYSSSNLGSELDRQIAKSRLHPSKRS